MNNLIKCKTLEEFKQAYQRCGENIFTNLLYSEIEELFNNMLAYETVLMLEGNPYDVDFRYYTFHRAIRKIVKDTKVEAESYTFWRRYYEDIVGTHGRVFIEKDRSDDEFLRITIDYYTLNITGASDVVLEGFWKTKVMSLIKHIEYTTKHIEYTIIPQDEYWGDIQELVIHVNELKQLVDGM
jgi:hypothetical protein